LIEEISNGGRGADVLEVIEDEEQPFVAQRRYQGRCQPSVDRFLYAQRLRDGHGDEVGVAY
jgi:hypothetical protein